jgi:hypothetical protein
MYSSYQLTLHLPFYLPAAGFADGMEDSNVRVQLAVFSKQIPQV